MDNHLNTLWELDNTEISNSKIIDIEEFSNYVEQNNFTVLTQNIRSIYSNFDDLQVNLQQMNHDVDVMILTECRLNNSKRLPLLRNYSSYHTTNQLNQNDGVVAYIKNNHLCRVTEVSLSHASAIQLIIAEYVIIGIYRSPSHACADNFITSLNSYLDTITTPKNIIITGDININLIGRESESLQQRHNRLNYLNMLAGHGLLPGHCLPTRESNCLDHVFLKFDKLKSSAFVAVLTTTITDHAMVVLNLAQKTVTRNCHRYSTSIDFENACKDLFNSDMSFFNIYNDPETLANKFIHEIKTILLCNTKTKTISNSKRILKPWISLGALRCIKLRNKMQLKLKKNPFNVILKITFRRFRNFCSNLIKKLKRQFHKTQIANSVKNPKQLWIKINEVTQFKTPKSSNTCLLNITPNPLDSLNRINQFFVKIGSTLAEDILLNFGNPTTTDICSRVSSFVLLETSPREVDAILMGLDSGSAPGWDGIPTKFLKMSRDFIVPLISQLANSCFKTGIFPAVFKRSLITPVHKSGDLNDVNNYRPISVLPCISKILEKLLNNRLVNYLNKFKILSNTQYGFRKGLSTQDAVTALTNDIIDNVDRGIKCVTIFLDLKKAFDTVSVPILLRRLEAIGIRDTALSLFRSYLQGRKQQVKINNLISEEETVEYGVPQGSVLGPTLFLIYINDLCNIRSNGGRIYSYADDTAIVYTGATWMAVKSAAELGLAEVAGWLNTNLLSLNVNKTNFICFTANQRSQPGYDFGVRIHRCGDPIAQNCSCQTIERVNSTKYLGVTVDQRLSWHLHIETIMARVRKLIWIFKNLRYVMPASLLNKVYLALAQSIIIYCIPVWGGATKTKFLDLERSQRALIKVMNYKPYRYSTDDLYRNSGLLSVRKLYILHITLRMHKTLPFSPGKLKKRRKDIVAYAPRVHTVFAQRQYTTQAAYIYNKLNQKLNIYPMLLYNCKNTVTGWLKTITYEETELILTRIR